MHVRNANIFKFYDKDNFLVSVVNLDNVTSIDIDEDKIIVRFNGEFRTVSFNSNEEARDVFDHIIFIWQNNSH